MDWDSTTSPAITRARLKHAAPDAVYDALQAYGWHAHARGLMLNADVKLEAMLEERNEPLIDLGLAKNATDFELLARLYQRARKGSGDAAHDEGMLIACLSNQVASGMLFTQRMAGIEDSELRRLALEGSNDQIKALMQNPAAGGVIRDVYAKNEPFDDIPDDRWLLMVQMSAGNRRLNIDDSSVDGPDMLGWDIHKGLSSLLRTAPETEGWVRALHYLLIGLAKDTVRTLEPGELEQILKKWAGVSIHPFGRMDGHEEGLYTKLSFVDEFRCLVAALYGRVFSGKNFEVQGGEAAADVALRCAFYGNGKLSPDQIYQGHERDGDAFVLAAMFNDGLLLDQRSRALFEPMISGYLTHVYERRCEQLAKKWRWFKPAAVTDEMRAAQEMNIADTGGDQVPESSRVDRLVSDIAELRAEIRSKVTKPLQGMSTWTAISLLVILMLLIFRH